MGVDTHNGPGNFFLPADKVLEARTAIYNQLAEAEERGNIDIIGDEPLAPDIPLEDMLALCDLDIELDESGNIIEFYFSSERPDMDACDVVARAIAPYVAPGSWQAFDTEGDFWCWYWWDGLQELNLLPNVDTPIRGKE